MGERVESGRTPGEIVEVYRRPAPCPGRLPGEIVEEYRQPGPAEVVASYRRPLPLSHPARAAARPPTAPSVPAPPPAAEPPLPAQAVRPIRQPGRGRQPGRKRQRRGLQVFLLFLAGLVALTAAARLLDGTAPWDSAQRDEGFEHYGWDWRLDPEEEETSKEITIPRWPTGQGITLLVKRDRGEELTIQEVYQQVNPSVVTVMVGLGRSMSVGTGVIFTSDGYILTNYHVVEGGQDCSVVLESGYSCDARYVAGDADNDLAILKVVPQDLASLGDLPAAQFGDSDLLSVGDRVYAIGNPLGWELRGTLTDGIVSAINRDVEVDGRTMTLIQTNAALNSGNSGGPLINAFGQVVGINVIKMSSDHSTVEGLGFAIPSATIDRIINDLLTWGEVRPEPLLGVTVLQKAAELEHGLRGLEVRAVSQDSAADRAGIREGDFLLTAAGEPLETSQDLLRVRRHCYVGDRLEITLWRDGEVLTVTMELEDADG